MSLSTKALELCLFVVPYFVAFFAFLFLAQRFLAALLRASFLAADMGFLFFLAAFFLGCS